MTESVILRPPKARSIAMREEYLAICADFKYQHCAAMLLGMFDHWTEFKQASYLEEMRKRQTAKKHKKKFQLKPTATYWVYMTQENIKEELFGLFGESVISRAIQELLDAGYIKRRQNHRNKWDRTWQYLFKTNVVQKAVMAWAISKKAPIRIYTESKKYGYGIERVSVQIRGRRNKEAIPQDSSQDSSQGLKPSPSGEIDETALLAFIGEHQPISGVALIKQFGATVQVRYHHMAGSGQLIKVNGDFALPDYVLQGQDQIGDTAARLEAAAQAEHVLEDERYQAVLEVFGAGDAQNRNFQRLLGWMEGARGEWKEYRLSRSITPDQLRAWGKWYASQNPKLSMVKEPDKVNGSISAWLDMQNGHKSRPQTVQQLAAQTTYDQWEHLATRDGLQNGGKGT